MKQVKQWPIYLYLTYKFNIVIFILANFKIFSNFQKKNQSVKNIDID